MSSFRCEPTVAETDKEANNWVTTQTLFFLNVVTNAQQNFTTTVGIRRRRLESPNACSVETVLWSSRFRGDPGFTTKNAQWWNK